MAKLVSKKVVKFCLTLLLFSVLIFVVDFYRTRTMPKAPELTAVTTIEGNQVDLSSLSEQGPVLIYFWATWCGPCKATSPSVQWLSRSHNVITVALDSGSNDELSAFLKQSGYSFPVINDQAHPIASAFEVSVTPTVVILKNGRVSSSTIGVSTPMGLFLRLLFA